MPCCILECPFAAAGSYLCTGRGCLMIGSMGDGTSSRWWARWQHTFWLGRWSLSLPPPLLLSPSRLSRTCVRVGPSATGSGPALPACHAVAGSRPPYPSWRELSMNLAMLQLATSVQFQVCDHLSFKFVIRPFVQSCLVLASSAGWLGPSWPSVGSASDGTVCRAAPVAGLASLPGAHGPLLSMVWTILVVPVTVVSSLSTLLAVSS